MALVPVCYKLPHKDGGGISVHMGFSHSYSYRVWKTKRDEFSVLCCRNSRHGSDGKQLRLLDTYLGKVRHDDSNSKKKHTKEELESLNAYLDKINPGNPVGVGYNPETVKPEQKKQMGSLELRHKGSSSGSWMAQSLQQSDDETSSLYLVSSEFQLFSLPLLYGAKINDLILTGEWWRLVTPMFLHSGAFHVALGCWSLVTFGPEVCRRYGSFTFILIYILGGLSGNLTSFLHTPDPSVGGTGPVFSIIGAWLVYNNQTKHDVSDKDTSDSLFQKAMMTTALSFILSHFGPIDDWTHLGSVLTGIAYGFFTCPALQLDDASLGSGGKDEGIAVVERRPDLCKSLMFFAIFMLFLGSLLFIVEPPLGTSMTEKDILGL
ncbi:RHOMBOID-like protein 9, chloroplastic [Linum perenne]